MFSGTYTAIVTPFNLDGSVDYVRYRELIEKQIAGGVAGIVPVGTTGESPTLSMEEHLEVVRVCAEQVDGRVQVIAGTGANATQEAVELTEAVIGYGVDATLQVTPYYNKPSPEGLYRHFSTIADLGLPVVLYNVPGRTSRDIPVAVVKRLADHPKVVAIKEAAGDVGRVSQIRAVCDLEVLSGDDGLALPMISVGACGLISVASNVVPREVSDLVRLALEGRMTEALQLHQRLTGLFADLFIEVNPVPVKAALAMMGRIEETYRLPLCEMAPENRRRLEATMQSLGLV
ncbi:MAG: 4-hydroxy-tetrahydrodipicolinate synthase [Kiritimatiellia bacterium]|jgi:4-hydroxy-tetrahydrodipicolinate synthase